MDPTSRSTPSTRTTRVSTRVDHAVVAPQRPPGELAELARHLHAGRAASDDDERHEAPALLGVRLGLGQLEGAEDLAPQRQGVVERSSCRTSRARNSSWPK